MLIAAFVTPYLFATAFIDRSSRPRTYLSASIFVVIPTRPMHAKRDPIFLRTLPALLMIAAPRETLAYCEAIKSALGTSSALAEQGGATGTPLERAGATDWRFQTDMPKSKCRAGCLGGGFSFCFFLSPASPPMPPPRERRLDQARAQLTLC